MSRASRSTGRPRAAKRPDVQALRLAVSRVERNVDDMVDFYEHETRRLRRLVLSVTKAYRLAAAVNYRSGPRLRAFVSAMDAVCVEADAIQLAAEQQKEG